MADQADTTPDTRAAARAFDLSSQGDKHYKDGRFQAAFDCFVESVRLRQSQPAYHHRLACAAWKLGRSAEVDWHYLKAIELNPRLSEPHKALAQWLLTQGQIERALYHGRMAHSLAPDDLDIKITRAAILEADGQAMEAWELVEPSINAGSMVWHVLAAYARLAPKVGHEHKAATAIQNALNGAGLSNPERATLHYCVAGLLDAIGGYDQAFSHARKGNELARRGFDPAGYSKSVQAKIEYFTPSRLQSLPRATHRNVRPIFIVGMPRSGTSLVEQILASHPAIFGGGELSALPDIAASLQDAASEPFTDNLNSFSISTANRLAAEYLRVIDSLNISAQFVTDKMPHNFEHLWLAAVLIPDCRVIHCIRDPRDTCLSCYFTDFNSGNVFSFDLGHLASFYRDYGRLTDHWKQVVTLPMLEVGYEDLVADVKGQTARMLEFLKLPWNDACLDFHKNKRVVTTASREQVRKPMYSSSIGRWRNYEKHIAELLCLGPPIS